jgi:hypothetical protein
MINLLPVGVACNNICRRTSFSLAVVPISENSISFNIAGKGSVMKYILKTAREMK